MNLVDANLLLYSYDASSPRHPASRSWFEGLMSSGRQVRFAAVTLLAFVRISSHRRVFARPLDPVDACGIVATWIDRPAVEVLEPGSRHWSLFTDLVGTGQARGPLVMDAYLAALAIEHGATLFSTDRDFSRFDGLDLVDPLR